MHILTWFYNLKNIFTYNLVLSLSNVLISSLARFWYHFWTQKACLKRLFLKMRWCYYLPSFHLTLTKEMPIVGWLALLASYLVVLSGLRFAFEEDRTFSCMRQPLLKLNLLFAPTCRQTLSFSVYFLGLRSGS